MSILTDKLPDYISIDQNNYKINTDFRVWIRVEQIIFSSLCETEKIAEILKLVCLKLPPSLYKTLIELFHFYNGNQKPSFSHNSPVKKRVRIYDFDHDADYIYSAFIQQYGIDLQTENLHWWQFRSLFACLSKDTKFATVLQFRSAEPDSIKNKEQRQFYAAMKKLYKLPDTRSDSEIDADIVSSILQAF